MIDMKSTTEPRLLFAAAQSGSGKTTIVCGILRALLNRKMQVAAFKSGPDYIDPMFHSRVIGADSRNLDLYLIGKEKVKTLFAKNSAGRDISILEGAMGFYDGMGKGWEASAYDLARTVKAPVVLIINGKGAALSMAAIIKGFKEFKSDSNIKGVILNNVTKMTYMFYKEVLEKESGVKLYGYFPRLEDCSLESRHLGLVTAEEVKDLDAMVEKLAVQTEETLDLDGLCQLAQTAEALEYEEVVIKKAGKVRIAVARDKAFCFYYKDALELLESMGAELVDFSPMEDDGLPDCDGLILGGGYPELYAEKLQNNKSMLEAVKNALTQGMPCYAECGGFMYLLEKYSDNSLTGSCNGVEVSEDTAGEAKEYSWAGAIKGESSLQNKLVRFGYVALTANRDNVFCKKGEGIHAHEFHYSDSNNNGEGFSAMKAMRKTGWQCVHADENMYAGYPHLHLWGNLDFAYNFVKRCAEFAEKKQ